MTSPAQSQELSREAVLADIDLLQEVCFNRARMEMQTEGGFWPAAAAG
jgi:hypothetical protein